MNSPVHISHCRCGAVEVSAWAEPLIVSACYCDDCQSAAERLAASATAAPTPSLDGGTEFMVFRRDRIACTRGADRLDALRLTDTTKTRRMIASCCTTPMYMTFDDKRPWVSAFRATFGANAPPVQMRICTRFRRAEQTPDDSVPSHLGYPPSMMMRILAAAPLALLRRPVGVLP